jgi:hypothetical protein
MNDITNNLNLRAFEILIELVEMDENTTRYLPRNLLTQFFEDYLAKLKEREPNLRVIHFDNIQCLHLFVSKINLSFLQNVLLSSYEIIIVEFLMFLEMHYKQITCIYDKKIDSCLQQMYFKPPDSIKLLELSRIVHTTKLNVKSAYKTQFLDRLVILEGPEYVANVLKKDLMKTGLFSINSRQTVKKQISTKDNNEEFKEIMTGLFV